MRADGEPFCEQLVLSLPDRIVPFLVGIDAQSFGQRQADRFDGPEGEKLPARPRRALRQRKISFGVSGWQVFRGLRRRMFAIKDMNHCTVVEEEGQPAGTWQRALGTGGKYIGEVDLGRKGQGASVLAARPGRIPEFRQAPEPAPVSRPVAAAEPRLAREDDGAGRWPGFNVGCRASRNRLRWAWRLRRVDFHAAAKPRQARCLFRVAGGTRRRTAK